MKKLFVLAALAALSGCASTETVLNRPVTTVYHSDSSANTVSFCLANKNNTAALDRDGGSKVVLIKNGYGAVSMAFVVYPEGSGSRIEYRKVFGTVGGIWRQCIGPDAQRKESLVRPVGFSRG